MVQELQLELYPRRIFVEPRGRLNLTDFDMTRNYFAEPLLNIVKLGLRRIEEVYPNGLVEHPIGWFTDLREAVMVVERVCLDHGLCLCAGFTRIAVARLPVSRHNEADVSGRFPSHGAVPDGLLVRTSLIRRCYSDRSFTISGMFTLRIARRPGHCEISATARIASADQTYVMGFM